MLRLAFIGLWLLSSLVAFTQDHIYTVNSDTINGKITEIRNDTLFLRMKRNNHTIHSYVTMNAVLDYHYGICKQVIPNSIYKFVLNDESVIYGSVQAIGKDSLSLISSFSNHLSVYNGAILEAIKQEVPMVRRNDNAVASLSPQKLLKSRETDSHWVNNPHATRYFFAPSAYTLEKGTGYYQNAYVLVNSVNYGITNYFSMGGGIEFVSTFSGEPTVFLTPKIGFKLGKKLGISAGAIGGILIGEDVAGIGYVNSTYGSIESNITIGLGWGYIVDEFYKEPIVNVNAMARIHKRFSLVTENWIIPTHEYDYFPPNYDPVYAGTEYTPYFSYGFRYFKDKISIDFAFINTAEIADFIFIGIPYIDFVLLF